MTYPVYPYLEEVNPLSELLWAFKHHTPYSKITFITEERIRRAIETGDYSI